MIAKELTCPNCGWRTICGQEELATRLRLVGLLRRDKAPDEDMILALAPDAVRRMTCPTCKSIGLRLTDADQASEQDDADWGDSDWQAAVLCEVCRAPIDPERLEFMPESKRCVACQGKAESGALQEDEPEFCPRCGALVELRVSSGGGLTRYKRFCTGSPPCRL